MNLLHQATFISMSLVRLVVAALSQQYIVIFSMLHCQICKINLSYLLLWLLCIDPPGPYTDFLKELADVLSDLLFNVGKAIIVGNFNIHVDNTNEASGLAFIDQ